MIKIIDYQNLKICTQSNKQFHTYFSRCPLICLQIFFKAATLCNFPSNFLQGSQLVQIMRGWFFWLVFKFVVYQKYIFWMIKKNWLSKF